MLGLCEARLRSWLVLELMVMVMVRDKVCRKKL